MGSSLWGAMLLLPAFHVPVGLHETIERDYHPAYLRQATGAVHAFQRAHQYPWPVKLHSIGNSTASYQDYGGQPYFHKGLDMRADAGSDVRAAVGGKVLGITNYMPGDPAYWEIAIQDDEGYIWQYHHVDRDSMTQEVLSAASSGQKIAAGTKLGEVYYWPIVSEGERYHHIHVNICAKNETWLTGLNFLEPLDDKTPPEIVEIFLTQNGERVDGTSVSGSYSLAVHARDLLLSEKFYLPPHELTIQIDDGAPRTVWRFDTLPGNSETKLVDRFFVPGLACGDYECRRPIIDLGFSESGAQVFPTGSGAHKVKVVAKDFAGNQADAEYHWTVSQ